MGLDFKTTGGSKELYEISGERVIVTGSRKQRIEIRVSVGLTSVGRLQNNLRTLDRSDRARGADPHCDVHNYRSRVKQV
jgi:hypothetical protein